MRPTIFKSLPLWWYFSVMASSAAIVEASQRWGMQVDRHHAFFTTVDGKVLDTVAVDKTHRKHALIEQVNADLKDSALAHLPSGVFAASSACLVTAVMAYNLTRAAGLLASRTFGKARTGTIRRKLIHVPARISYSARRICLHLPESWPWQTPWQALIDHLYPPQQRG